MSVAIGASVAGARAYTATASQGLLFMVEAVYNASGLGLPDRHDGRQPCDRRTDQHLERPFGLHEPARQRLDPALAETNQEAVDLHIQAFRIAEELSLPVMVCMDGFVLTHAFERMDIPSQEDVDAFLPPYEPRQVLDPDHPYSIGAMVGPEAFTEVRWLAHKRMLDALPAIEKASADFAERFGRKSGGLLDTYRMEDAEVCVLAMGSILGTIKDTVDEMREAGVRIGVLCLKSYRPFPDEALREAVKSVKTLVVLERMVSAGSGGALYLDVLKAVRREPVELRSVIAGLGGRAVTKASLRAVFESACNGTLPDETVFLDLDRTLVEHQLAREAEQRHTGPVAESLNREVNERKILQGEEI